MTAANDLKVLSLDELAILYRVKAEACARTSYPLKGYEPFFDAHERVAMEVERRGGEAMERVLLLVDHPEPWVRYFAARDCYTVAAERCHSALFKLVEDLAMPSSWAIQTLLYFDPTFPDQLRALNRRQGIGSGSK